MDDKILEKELARSEKRLYIKYITTMYSDISVTEDQITDDVKNVVEEMHRNYMYCAKLTNITIEIFKVFFSMSFTTYVARALNDLRKAEDLIKMQKALELQEQLIDKAASTLLNAAFTGFSAFACRNAIRVGWKTRLAQAIYGL